MEGSDLQKLIHSGELSTSHALELIPQICSALQFAHDQGIVHRDIKPANILINKQGEIKIADFGLAKVIDTAFDGDTENEGLRTLSFVSMGTPGYVAPETLSHGSRDADHRADIYALGVMIYEMLTGKVPFGAFQSVSQSSPSPDLDPGIDEIVEKAMQPDREDRYQSASEISRALKRVANEAPSRNKERKSKAGLWIAFAILLVVAGVGGVMWKFQFWENAKPLAESQPKQAIESLKIDLPPALAAMKKRGGRLRAWGKDINNEDISIDDTEIDDFIQVAATGDGQWMGLRGTGQMAGLKDVGFRFSPRREPFLQDQVLKNANSRLPRRPP